MHCSMLLQLHILLPVRVCVSQEKILKNELAIAILELKIKCGMGLKVEIGFDKENLEKEDNYMDLSLKQYKNFALKKRPEVNSLEKLVLQTEYAERISKAENWPGISLEGTIGRSGEAYVKEELSLATEWGVYANLQWLFWGSSMGFKIGKKRTEPSSIIDYSVRTKTEERFIQMSILDRMDYFYQRQEKRINRKQATKFFTLTGYTSIPLLTFNSANATLYFAIASIYEFFCWSTFIFASSKSFDVASPRKLLFSTISIFFSFNSTLLFASLIISIAV